MKAILSLTILLSSFAAKADIIKCYFTEPFLTVTYSMTQSKLTVKDEATQDTYSIKAVSFQIKGPGQFELWNSSNKAIMELDLNFQGSDGMSDNIYPYTAMYLNKGIGILYGGCTSNFVNEVVSAENLN